MDCKRAQELILPFINGQLAVEEAEDFLGHMDCCRECREELEVSYALLTAMRQLDDGADLSDNYAAELSHKIEECYLKVLRRKRSSARRWAFLVILLVLLMVVNVIIVAEYQSGTGEHFLRGMEQMEVNGKESP